MLQHTMSPWRALMMSLTLLAVAVIPFGFATRVNAAPLDCKHNRCGLPGDGPNLRLAIGTVTRVASDAEAQTVFRWARAHHYWRTLSASADDFTKSIQLVAIQIPGPTGPRDMTLLMGRKFFDAIKIAVGDFVRYQPHARVRSVSTFDNPSDAAYWNLFGCIAVLCRASDRACPSRYVAGMFAADSGKQVDSYTGTPLASGVRIDKMTYLPLPPQ